MNDTAVFIVLALCLWILLLYLKQQDMNKDIARHLKRNRELRTALDTTHKELFRVEKLSNNLSLKLKRAINWNDKYWDSHKL